jgi:hypothetical protein
MTKDTGGPAFPSFESHLGYGQMLAVGGMTLRDYAAIKAMQGFVMDDVLCKEAATEPEWYVNIAEASYKMADAMLKARAT